LQDPANLGSSSSRLQSYFQTHAGIYEGSLGELTRAAFELYLENGARSFRLESLERRVGPEVVASLLAAELLRLDGEFAFFSHHLLHDYLAARFVAANDRTWTADTFQSITFGANSFDTLVFALEQIPSVAAGDLFARLVFDWNPYAVAYSISEAATQDLKVSEAMQFVLLAMLAERQFDLIAASAVRASDALAVFPSADASDFLRAGTIRDVIHIVSNRTYDTPWFRDWRELFTERSGGSVEGHAVRMIGERDSIVGWTAANVIKRLRVDEGGIREVRGYAASDSSTIRWRAAHALGAFPDDESIGVLLGLLNDADAWVRYGSIRSLVEASARGTAGLRSGIFRKLAALVAARRIDVKTLREFEKAIFLAKGKIPPDWIPAVSPVLECLFDSAESLNDHDHWAEVAVRLKAWMNS
jgi:HEAT repeat protein